MSSILKQAGVAGPVFVSVGESSQLAKFLELNPKIPKQSTFVDDSTDFDAYTTAGFVQVWENNAMGGPPRLSGGEWWKYVTNMMSLTPKQEGGGMPKGALKLGGTFVIEDDRVIYAWADSKPGDLPIVDDVLKEAVSSS